MEIIHAGRYINDYFGKEEKHYPGIVKSSLVQFFTMLWHK